jgi:hypothetical protein
MSNNTGKREFFSDSKGRWIGSATTESNGRKTYLDSKGGLAGRVHDGKTTDKKGAFFGKGDQGQRLFK